MTRAITLIAFLFLSASLAVGGEVSGEVDHDFWSGDYWPRQSCDLAFSDFSMGISPLEKYDNYVLLTRGEIAGAAAREADPARRHNRANGGVGWSGHCNGLAASVILEDEPPVQLHIPLEMPVTFQGLVHDNPSEVEFGFADDLEAAYTTVTTQPTDVLVMRTADMKGLLTELHSRTQKNFYGRRYREREIDPEDPKYRDIHPHVFHEVLMRHVREEKHGVVLDLMPDRSVWNYAVHRFDSSWESVGSTQHVTTTVHMASSAGPGHRGLVSFSETYTYDLFLDDSGAIVGGEWTGASIHYHPDFAWVPYSVLNTENNASLDIEVYREMLDRGVHIPDTPDPPGDGG